MEDIKLDVYVPIDVEGSLRKSEQTKDGEWIVRGYASTPDLDLQGDIVQPKGIDIDYFLSSGWINYEHKNDAEYVIGVPTENCYIDMEKGLFVEAKLFKDNIYAQQMWNLAKSLHKSDVERNLGFSIEGAIRKRNHLDNRIIEDLTITNVAITKNPANQQATWEMFMKSWETGHEINPEKQQDVEALRRESLARAIDVLTWTYNHPHDAKLWKDVAKYLDKADKNSLENATLLLQVSKGISRKQAEQFLKDNR